VKGLLGIFFIDSYVVHAAGDDVGLTLIRRRSATSCDLMEVGDLTTGLMRL